MIKAIIFDFDGVILESADIKTEAFRELFSGEGEKVEEIVDYHVMNGGISRYVKFRHIYENILKTELSQERELELGELFSEIALRRVLKAPFVAGVKEFLAAHKDRYAFFIVSGTPEEELYRIMHAREIEDYFAEIHGSPGEKIDIINDILDKSGLEVEEAVYVGDAESDRIAAERVGMAFIQRISDPALLGHYGDWVIENLEGFEKVLQEIEKQHA